MMDMSRAAAIILAAGHSSRFGADNKLLHALDGEPIIVKSARTAIEAKMGEIIVVTGYDASAVQHALTGLSVTIIRNATPEAGMGTSLAAGANAIRSLPDVIMVMLGDMPFLDAKTLPLIASKFEPKTGHDIVVPVYEGQRGHPVLFGAKYLPALCALTGDTGARSILQNYPERVRAVKVKDPGTRYDIDTENDLTHLPSSV